MHQVQNEIRDSALCFLRLSGGSKLWHDLGQWLTTVLKCDISLSPSLCSLYDCSDKKSVGLDNNIFLFSMQKVIVKILEIKFGSYNSRLGVYNGILFEN